MKFVRFISVFLFLTTCFAFCESKLYWQAVRGEGYRIAVWASCEDADQIYIKGPQMADYELFDVDEGTMIGWRMENLTLEELNTQSLGVWFVMVTFFDKPANVSSFEISGGIYESEFPPVPSITYPADGDNAVVAENCVFTWEPNGADTFSHMLTVSCEGENYMYVDNSSNGTIPITLTQWNPGWLEQGPAFMKIGYWAWMMHKRTVFTHVSGSVMNWDSISPYAVWLSGDRVEFNVTKSADINSDGIIDFADFAVIAKLWLQSR
jgi:hypothetical protein